MGDHERESDPGERQERWRALQAALDRADDVDNGDDTGEDTEVDLSESEPLEIERTARAERGDETAATEEFGTASPRVLTVDLADEFAGVDRERRGPVLTVGDDEEGD